MLIWLFLQNKNFSAAFVQVVALDKRLRNMGARVMELGKMAIENESFEEARKCFYYVIELGIEAPYYFEAEMAMLNTRYVELSLFKIYTNDHKYFLKDLNSSNGTFLNGFKIVQSRLNHGDIIKVGEITIYFFI